MKNRVITMLLATAMSCTIFVAPAFATEAKEDNYPTAVAGLFEIMPFDLAIATGNYDSNIEMIVSKKLNRDNGKYVNFYVENKGNISVVATINGEVPRTYAPGEKGHISLEVTQGWFGFDKDYEFKVESVKDGGSVNIYYEIAQRNSQQFM